jgi:hypothetical protein
MTRMEVQPLRGSSRTRRAAAAEPALGETFNEAGIRPLEKTFDFAFTFFILLLNEIVVLDGAC